MTRLWHSLAAGLLALHPLVVWTFTQSGFRWPMLVIYLLLGFSFQSLMRYGDVRALLNAAFCLALATAFDARLLFVILASVPFLALLAPVPMLRASPGAFWLVMLFPAVAILLSFVYVHHFFPGIPFGALQMMGVERGGLMRFPLGDHDRQAMFPLLLLAGVCAFPLAVAAPFLFRAERLVAVPLLMTALAPMIAAFAATEILFPDHPGVLIVLLAVPAWMAAQALIARGRARAATALLALGWLGGAALFFPVMEGRL